MKNNFLRKVLVWALIPCFTFTSCDSDTLDTVFNILDEVLNMLGYNPETENVEDQETADDESDTDVSDTKVSWESYCPPIGNQGSYGTCVVWATGYNLKTTLNRIDGKWSSASSTSYQCSPADLWFAIPSSGKSTSCNGSNFDPALQALIDKGVATLSEVPYSKIQGNCDNGTAKGSSSNKLGQFRIVAYSADMSSDGKAYGMTVNNIKYYLKNGPLVIGAQLGGRFMSWNSSSVLTYDDETYNGQHAYHAMALVGFDDSKNAFRVRNSWGADDWGDDGSIWIDYDFFVDQFCFGVWSASNSSSSTSATSLKSSSSSNDVAVNIVSDKETTTGERVVTFTVKNNGSSAISTANYPIVYMLFKARHLVDRFMVMDEGECEATTVKPGETVTLSHTYVVPAAASDGKYALALIADPYDKIGDKKRADNFSILVGELGVLQLNGRKIVDDPQSTKVIRSLKDVRKNAYSDDEITLSLQKGK